VYNIGGQSQTTILNLAEMVGKKLSKKVIIPIDDSNTLIGNPNIVNISIERYMKEFNKINFINLDKGLDMTIDWQRRVYK
jgi:dTDP-glucose 4,6-dehydratase/UDP-glucuronate decarboxylase